MSLSIKSIVIFVLDNQETIIYNETVQGNGRVRILEYSKASRKEQYGC
jgi:hypothetical protein